MQPPMPAAMRPYWVDRVPASRRPSYPALRGKLVTDVVVVGGGLTGCVTAWAFASAGVGVVVIEAGRIGERGTGAGPGIIREDFDASFEETVSAHGLRAARSLWQSMRRASLDAVAGLKRAGVKAGVAPHDLLRVATAGRDAALRLQREYRVRRDAGFDHSWVAPAAVSREANIEAGGAIRTRGASVDPYRACVGMAAAAQARGATFHERSPVSRIRGSRTQVEVVTPAGSVQAGAVVVATSAAIQDLGQIRRHLTPAHVYSVVTQPLPAAMRREAGRRAASLTDTALPPHVLRWLDDDRVLYTGAEQPAVPERGREKALVQRAGQLMYELSTIYPAFSGIQAEWAWDAGRVTTADALPLIGAHRNYPRHLFALGDGRHGPAAAWLGARVLLREYQQNRAKGDDLLGFARIL